MKVVELLRRESILLQINNTLLSLSNVGVIFLLLFSIPDAYELIDFERLPVELANFEKYLVETQAS